LAARPRPHAGRGAPDDPVKAVPFAQLIPKRLQALLQALGVRFDGGQASLLLGQALVLDGQDHLRGHRGGHLGVESVEPIGLALPKYSPPPTRSPNLMER